MRVATLYDLHGKVIALEAVLHEIPDEATIVVGGDVCAGGTHPSETLERLRALGERVVWLRGNADRELTPGEKGLAPAEVIEATRSALTAEQIAFLHALPRTVQIDDMLFCHATPRNDLDIFTERTPEGRIAHLFADVDANVVVCGHTHTQFERTIAGKRVINSGSVGMPYEDAPGAYWTLDLTHRRTEYDGAESPKIGREEAISHFEALAVGDCDDVPVPRVVRLLTLADVGDGGDARRISVSARHEAVLEDGRRVVLLDDRGWSEELRGAGADEVADIWALSSEQDIAETARTVVGPDEPFGERTRDDMETDHWNTLAEKLHVHGVVVEAGELKQLPHEFVVSEALLARLGRGSGDAA